MDISKDKICSHCGHQVTDYKWDWFIKTSSDKAGPHGGKDTDKAVWGASNLLITCAESKGGKPWVGVKCVEIMCGACKKAGKSWKFNKNTG